MSNRVYLEQTTTVGELAVLARRVEVEREMLHTWAGSTKRIKLHGTYLVKAGFDLRKRFTVNVHPNEILIELPCPDSFDQTKTAGSADSGQRIVESNFPDDIQGELAALPEQARQRATALPAEAEQTFTRQLLEKFRPEQPVRAIFPAPAPRG